MAKNKPKKAFEKPENRDAALELAILSLEKDFGKGAIIIGNHSHFPEIGRIPSGSLSLNKALGGGYAKGRIVEVSGPESSGKTTLALHAIAECQKQGGTAAFVDAEHALDIDYAKSLGVNVEKLLIAQPDSGEQALNTVERLARSGAVDLIIVDSVAALVPQVELSGEIGDSSMGLQARLMSQAMRMLVGIVHKTDVCVIFINQIRMKIGVMFGNPEVGAGGQALKFYASQRLDIRRIDVIQDGEDKTGIRTRVKVVKNKVAPPFRIAEFNILFGSGIDTMTEIVDMSVDAGLVQKSGSWYKYGETKLGQGTAGAARAIMENEELYAELINKLLDSKITTDSKSNASLIEEIE